MRFWKNHLSHNRVCIRTHDGRNFLSLLIASIGDTASTIIGKPFGGRICRRFNDKSIEGFMAFFIFSVAPVALLFPLWTAVISCLVSAAVELHSVQIGNFVIDDNLTVPFASALTLSILSTITFI